MTDDRRPFVRRLGRVPIWFATAVGLVTSVVTCVILIRENMLVIAVAVGAIGSLLLLSISCYILFARSDSVIIGGAPQFRFKRYRLLAAITAGLITCGIGVCLSIETSRKFLRSVLLDARSATTTAGQVDIVQLQVGRADARMVFDVTIRNSLSQAVLVKKIVLSGLDRYGVGHCCCPTPTRYRLADQFALIAIGRRHLLLGDVFTVGDDGYRGYVRGRFADDNCASRHVTLMFDTTYVLEPRGYSRFRVEIPTAIAIVDSQRPQKHAYVEMARFKNVLVQCVLDRPRSVLAASIGPLPANATVVEDENDWGFYDALNEAIARDLTSR